MAASLGKTLVFVGMVVIALGLIIWVLPSIPLIGRLPGDIYIRRESSTFYFPLTTCLILSIILTLLFVLLRR
ncbi:MAG: DUF2905 domain-containing protein [Candidatus Binataceae bacterium]